MRGEYDFYTLVVALLVLLLQIHNPFQPKCVCACGGGSGAAASAEAASPLGRPLEQSSSRAARQAPEPQAPVYRRPQAPPPGGAGLSTDALLRELDSIQAKAKEQTDMLTAAGKMPPASPILQQIKESEASSGVQAQRPRAAVPPGVAQPRGPSATAAATPPAGAGSLLRRRDDFGRFLQARQPQGLGVVLGVGRGDFALRLLSDWSSAQGVYLVDPFIHIWRGYDDPANLQDREHQMIFEDLRNRLAPFEGRYVLVRDFSHSFAETYGRGGQTPGPPTFVYVDANPSEEAVTQDLEQWWQLLAPGGIIAGGSYHDAGAARVRSAVDRFASRVGAQVLLTGEDAPPTWFCVKP